jgi:hypothetical protein
MSDVLPLLAVIRAPVRGLAATLPQVATEPATSPWSPKAEAAAAPPPVDADAIREVARREGREECLRETEALRARLAELIGALEQAHALVVPATVGRIADAAACVVDAWFAGADRRELFEPLVAGWLAGARGTRDAGRAPSGHRDADHPAASGGPDDGGPTVRVARTAVHVHPDDVAAMTAAIDAAPLAVVADAALARGEVRIRGGALELAHSFEHRLPELRTAILAALEAP